MEESSTEVGMFTSMVCIMSKMMLVVVELERLHSIGNITVILLFTLCNISLPGS